MIARLLSSVFYIITRKLLGAFYVDQKKKGLLPSTLPSEHESEHEQWGNGKTSKLIGEVAFPIDYSKPLAAVPYDITGKGGIAYVAAIVSINNTGFTVTTDSNNESLGAFGWISVGF